MTIEKLEETTRNEIATKLPKMLEKVLTSYELFSDEHVPDPKDVKNFRDHHSACKVAIGHIQLLLKLADWAKLPDAQVGSYRDQLHLKMLMQESKETIEEDKDIHGEEDD